MTSVTRVPETTTMSGEELSADDVWRVLRHAPMRLYVEAFVRFRYGDGFSHSRALGLQLCLAFIPLMIAVIGLSGTLSTHSMGSVLRLTLLSLTPGASEEVIRNTLSRAQAEDGDGAQVALWLGVLFALVTLTTGMGQVERGINRIYGIERDRPTLHKYGRALLMALVAGVPALLGFVVLIAGTAFGEAVEQVYAVDDDFVTAIALPAGVALLVVSITAMLRYSPRRRQPGWSWLALGAGVAVVLTLGFTALLTGYIAISENFGTVYGPLTGVIALLLWGQLTSVAIFLGVALASQLEAARAGVRDGAVGDPERPHDTGSGADRRVRPTPSRQK